jgi:hypothetical protein
MLFHILIGIFQILLFGDLIDVPPPTAHPHVSFDGQLIFFKVQVNSLLQIRVKPPASFGKTQFSVTKKSAKNK